MTLDRRRRPGQKPLAHEARLDALLDTVSQTTATARKSHVTLVLGALYVVISALSVTDVQLLKQSPLELPLIKMGLPLLWFFVLIPTLLLVLHIQLLLQLGLLSRILAEADKLIRILPPAEQDEARARIPTFKFNVMLVGNPPKNILGWLVTASVWLSMIFFPLSALLSAHYGFLPYQGWIPWYHLGLCLADAALIFLLWPRKHRPNRMHGPSPAILAGFLLTVAAVCSASLLFNNVHASLKVTDQSLYTNSEDPVVIAALLERNATLTVAQVRQSLNTPLNLAERNLRGAVLFHSDLQGANLDGADLPGADLTNCTLRDASMFEANMRQGILHEADLRKANLSYANLRGIEALSANLSGTKLSGVDARGANLTGSDLSGANLSGAILTGADLTGTDLRGALLFNADLRGAGLVGADLRGAYLEYADLTGADLIGAKIHGATFANATLDLCDFRLADTTAMTREEWNSLVRLATDGNSKEDLDYLLQLLDGARAIWAQEPPVPLTLVPASGKRNASIDAREASKANYIVHQACFDADVAKSVAFRAMTLQEQLDIQSLQADFTATYNRLLLTELRDSKCDSIARAIADTPNMAEALEILLSRTIEPPPQ